MIIHRYIYKGFIVQFIPLWLVLSLSYLMLSSGELMSVLSVQSDAFYFIAMMFGFGLDQTLPVAMTITFVIVFSRLRRDGELDVISTSGLDLLNLLYPTLYMALMLFLIQSVFSHFLTPQMLVQRKKISYKSSLAALVSSPPPSQYEVKIGQYSMSYKEFRDGTFHAFIMKRYDYDGNAIETYQAKRASVSVDNKNVILTLFDCIATLKARKDAETKIDRWEYSFPADLDESAIDKSRYFTTPNLHLISRESERELEKRIIIPASLFFLAALSSSVGMMFNLKSPVAGLALSVPVVAFYYTTQAAYEIASKKLDDTSQAGIATSAAYIAAHLAACIITIKKVRK